MKQRDISIDNLKAFAIILVVFGHSMQYMHYSPFDGYEKMFLNPVNKWIYLIHMPLFVFSSGIFHKNTQPLMDFIKKIFLRLILPMVIWAIPCVLYNYFFENKDISLTLYKGVLMSGWWFIWMIVECKIALYLLSKLEIKWIAVLIVITLYIIYPYPSNLILIPGYNLFLSCLPFYLAGYYYSNNKDVFVKWSGWTVFLLMFVVLVVVSLVWDEHYAMYRSKFGIDVINYYYFVVRCIAGFSGIFLCLFIFKRFFNTPIKYITNCGKETFGIYILQFFYCSILRTYFIEPSNLILFYMESLLSSILCIVISMSIIKMIRYSTKLSKLLFG